MKVGEEYIILIIQQPQRKETVACSNANVAVGAGFQLGSASGGRSDTPISGVNNTAAVRLPSLQKQPQIASNKVNLCYFSQAPCAAFVITYIH